MHNRKTYQSMNVPSLLQAAVMLSLMSAAGAVLAGLNAIYAKRPPDPSRRG